VANSTMTARRTATFVLNGEKTWISNGGIADVYTRLRPHRRGPGAKGLSAFHRDARLAGLRGGRSGWRPIAPHPLATCVSRM
jgi:acyl-CoA dehydrogenase